MSQQGQKSFTTGIDFKLLFAKSLHMKVRLEHNKQTRKNHKIPRMYRDSQQTNQGYVSKTTILTRVCLESRKYK